MKIFLWKNIVCHFGVSRSIVSNNDVQLESQLIKEFIVGLKINYFFSTMRNPQNKGQAESTNKTIINSLKKRVKKVKGRWINELPRVLWDNHTSKRKRTDEIPFVLACGSETVIPTEVVILALRRSFQLKSSSRFCALNWFLLKWSPFATEPRSGRGKREQT